ncbi:MAG: hypothetical protein ACREBG_23645 [Pyrinomonadaceae bacterium]
MTIDSQHANLDFLRSKIPIIIGVTGHRDIRQDDIPKLQEQVRKILEELHRKYPATSLLVLSPLAEGADRLVAQVALENTSNKQARARLFVPLPLPREEYEKDFETRESKTEFHDLLKQAWKCFELPLVTGNTSASIQQYGPDRNKQYAQVGAYIARHSHILIALWDGKRSGLEGGTAQIVDFKLNGIPGPYAPQRPQLDIVDNGPVYHIVTPRIKNPTPDGTPFNLLIKFPEGWKSSDPLEVSYGRIFERMDTFNRDANNLCPRIGAEIEKNRQYVIPEPKALALSEAERFILDRYAIADTLAVYFQRWRRLTLITLFLIAVVAVFSFEVYADLLAHPFILAIYPLSLATAASLYLVAKRKDFQNKHLDYRALAEGLRVQLFWSVSGLSDEVADHYLRQHRTELEWIRNAIRAWNVVAEHGCVATGPTYETIRRDPSKSLAIVLEHWVEDQRKFFEKATKRDRDRLNHRERIVLWFFFFGLGLAGLVVLLHLLLPEFREHSPLRHPLIVVMGIAPAIAAAIGGYAQKMAFSAQAKRYDWMRALFDRAARRLKLLLKGNDYQAAQQLILDLAIEALEENGDWVMIHRERTPDVYKGA